jgi:hypothetical protein
MNVSNLALIYELERKLSDLLPRLAMRQELRFDIGNEKAASLRRHAQIVLNHVKEIL